MWRKGLNSALTKQPRVLTAWWKSVTENTVGKRGRKMLLTSISSLP